jgi:hypothetical protein
MLRLVAWLVSWFISALAWFVLANSFTPVAAAQSRAEYSGGTSAQLALGTQGRIDLSDDDYFAFYSRKAQVRVPYDHIDLVEYGQTVNPRLAMLGAFTIGLLSKSRKHFLTIGYRGDDGKRQALVFQVDKNGIRATLAGLEARTGVKVEYQDDEARKAGNG